MIGKQNIGRGFRGTLNYVLEKDQAQLIGGNMLGENPQELATEFAESRSLRPNLGRAVYHTSLSAAPKERLSDQKWNQVAGKYLEAMGFQGCQYVVVRHQDTELDHIHIVASRIPVEGPEKGKTVSDSQNYERSETVLRGIEKEQGLQRVTPSREVERRAPTRGELEMAEKGIASTKIQLQGLIDAAIGDQPTMSQFIERMDTAGVGVIPNIAKTGHVSGISFVLDNEQMKGSDLGKGYTWAGLQRRGVEYDQERDGESISRAKEQREASEPGREDRSVEQDGVEESRTVDREDRDSGRSNGEGDGRDNSDDEGDADGSDDGDEGDRQLDGESEVGGKEDRGEGRKDDSEDLDSDDPGRSTERAGRGEHLRALATALRSTSGGSRTVEKLHNRVPEPERGQATGIEKALGLGSKEVDLEAPQLADPLKVNRKKPQKKKDPFSFDVGKESKPPKPDRGHERDDEGPGFFDL